LDGRHLENVMMTGYAAQPVAGSGQTGSGCPHRVDKQADVVVSDHPAAATTHRGQLGHENAEPRGGLAASR